MWRILGSSCGDLSLSSCTTEHDSLAMPHGENPESFNRQFVDKGDDLDGKAILHIAETVPVVQLYDQEEPIVTRKVKNLHAFVRFAYRTS